MIKTRYELNTQLLRYGEVEYLKIEKNWKFEENFYKRGNTYTLIIKNSDLELELCKIKKVRSKWCVFYLDIDNIGGYAYNDIMDNNEYIHKTLKDVINMIITVLNKYSR